MKNLWCVIAACGLATVATAKDVTVGWLEISDAPTERPSDLAWLLGNEDNPTLRELVDAIEGVADDDSLKGLVIRVKDAHLTSAQVQELGGAIRHVRDAGKKVNVFAETFETAEFLLGSYADHVACQKGGEVSLPGIYMEEMFLADALAWAGVKANYVQIGDYKGASEQMARGTPSKEWDQNINQLLDGLYANVRKGVMEGRKLDGAQLDAAMNELWMADASEAVKARLIDAEIDLPAYDDFLNTQYGEKVSIESISAGEAGELHADTVNPFGMLALLSKTPEHKPKGPALAVLHIDGAIIDGDSTGGFSGGGEVGSRTIRNALEDILKDTNIKGVVVRIDSPGGSAVASEIIWQGVRRVADVKPVWVSVGDMAASGGYYIAVSGDKIFVDPSSIVGSIGVVGGKLSMQGLYDKLKINVVGRARGPHAAMFSSASNWSDADTALVRQKMTATYDLFTKRVAAGRKGIDLTKTAEGRLFTGTNAIEMKMADEIGGLDDALEKLGSVVVPSGEYEVFDYPTPRPLAEVMSDMAQGMGGIPGLKAPLHAKLSEAVREVVGRRVFEQLKAPLDAMVQMREGKVLLISPRVLIVR
jgi:protease-4